MCIFYPIYNITLEFEITRTFMCALQDIIIIIGTREYGLVLSVASNTVQANVVLLSYPTGNNCDYCSAMLEMGFHPNVKITESFVFKTPIPTIILYI